MSRTEWSPSAIRRRFPGDRYVAYHAPRYSMMLTLMKRYVPPPGGRILDIGGSKLSALIHQTFSVTVDTLDLGPDGPRPYGVNFNFDLNQAQWEDRWRADLLRYDLVVMAEVIEHLHTAPERVLRFVRSVMNERAILILQTPNAVSLHKRVKMLAGRNPYELIREDATDPGHFREYTRRELFAGVTRAGFTIERWLPGHYFDYSRPERARFRRPLGIAANVLYRWMPASLQPGQTLVARSGGVNPLTPSQPRPG